MNCHLPSAISFSFEGFSARGGGTDLHKDGWGIAFYGDEGCQLFTDHLSSVTSPMAAEIKRNPIKSRNIIAHIRKATQGPVAPENSHPFMRELWGQQWTFAHNGDLKNFDPAKNKRFSPSGATDSERAFCALMSRMEERFPDSGCPPPLPELFDHLAILAGQIAGFGTFNFMLSNGEVLFAYCSTNLHYVTRAYPFSTAKLIDCDVSIDFSQHNHRDDRMIVIATQPLTSNETWIAFHSGELKMFSSGQIRAQCTAVVPTEAQSSSVSADSSLLETV